MERHPRTKRLVAALGLAAALSSSPAAADIYGNGSAGARTVSAIETLSDSNLQYTSFTVEAGAVLSVPSGTVIRCTGPFINNGYIRMLYGARGGVRGGSDTAIDLAAAPAHPGVSHGAAGSGELGAVAIGGAGGLGLSAAEARMILRPGPNGGGGGGAARSAGARGGGSFTVLAQTAVVNNGTIAALAESASPGGGGGAGGIVILASSGSVTNNGAVSARGSHGGRSDADEGAGGGGGGGIVHFLAPVIDGTGGVSVSRGSGGAAGGIGSVTAAIPAAGGGGGACGGSGARGGGISSAGDPGSAGFASQGIALRTLADPAGLF